MHYERLQIADTSFNTHEQLKIFQQPDSQLSITASITHSGKDITNILKSIQTRT